MQRTQRTHRAMEGDDMCSRFFGLSSVVGVYGCGHDEPEKSPPAAFQLLYRAQAGRIYEARTLTIVELSKGLSSLCHWEPEAARTSEKERS